MSTHTPGPWKLAENSVAVYYWPETEAACEASEAAGHPVDVVIAKAGGELPFDRDIANIRLIAAAPDLLAACRAMLECCGGNEYWQGETKAALELIERALDKAEGRS